jgi:succinate dehydrogenase/fumarate reductase flavoprotein subunit
VTITRNEIQIDRVAFPVYSMNTLIIGSGAAGLNAALQLVRNGQRDVAIVTERFGAGTSFNAGSDKQTYYKLALAGAGADSPRLLAEDLYRGGCMHGDIALCEAQHSAQAFFNLVSLGVPFPHDRCGGFVGYRTDHDPRGRGTSAGPLTSRHMCEALGDAVRKEGVEIFDHHTVVALLTAGQAANKRVCGAIAINQSEIDPHRFGFVLFNAVNIILATGGPGGMYRDSVYPQSQVGSTGLALAIGAVAHNLTESQFGLASVGFRWNLSGSYQQAIPRYVSTDSEGRDAREFLNDHFPDMRTLTTAIFRKGYEWPFSCERIADHGSSLIDLLVCRETAERGRHVFLDYTLNPSGVGGLGDFSLHLLDEEARTYLERSGALRETPIERLRAMNQPAIDLFRSHGIDLATERLEIAVCAQHSNGGIRGDIWWESGIRHLFPIGEVSGTHGVRRPGGAALNAGQVGAIRAALFIAKRYKQTPPAAEQFAAVVASTVRERLGFARQTLSRKAREPLAPADAVGEIQQRMSENAAHIRESARIEQVVQDAWSLVARLGSDLAIALPSELPAAFRAVDMGLTHAVYLEAIAEYLAQGGKSRGSAIVLDPCGQAPCASLGDEWRFSLNEPDAMADGKILEIWLDDDLNVHKAWVDIRPIPDDDLWFERVWNDSMQDRIVR